MGAPADPGLENLATLLAGTLPDNYDRFPDVAGLRANSLWEAVFLFHKCAHTHLATHRIGQDGMHSWSLFNAYHSAYLGARGIMILLGVPMPSLKGSQVAIDLFPEPTKRNKRSISVPLFQEFVIVRLPLLEQRHLWEGFQRVLRMSQVECWDASIRDELLDLSYEKISPPRNHYLYKASFWPFTDLMIDAALVDFNKIFGRAPLDVSDDGFLMRLCFSVYRLFEQLMADLAAHSAVIRQQYVESRIYANAGLPVTECYANFVDQISAGAA